MDDSLKQEEQVEDLSIDPSEVDFTLDEKELEDVSGGTLIGCAQIGLAGSGCTQTGV